MANFGHTQKWEGYGTKKISIWFGDSKLEIEYKFNCWHRRLEGIYIKYKGAEAHYFHYEDVILSNIYGEGEEEEIGNFTIIYGDGGGSLETEPSAFELFKSFSRKYKGIIYDVLNYATLETDLDLLYHFLSYLKEHLKYEYDRKTIEELEGAISKFIIRYKAEELGLYAKQ